MTAMTMMTKKTAPRGFLEQRLLFGGFGILVTIILIFGIWRAQDLILGPQITFSVATDPSGFVTLSGVVERNSRFEINGAVVAPEQNGNFEERLFLTPGHTIMEIRAWDRFDRVTTKQVAIYIPQHARKEINIEETDSSSTNQQGGEELEGGSST